MSVLTGLTYSISRGTGRCAASDRELRVGETHVAVLVERSGQEGLERLDYSAEAWEAGARPGPPLALFASWRTTVAEPNARKSALLADDELLELFERLGEATEPRRLAFRYLLALMLVRRRVLVYEGSRAGVLRVKPKRPAGELPEPEVVEVADPKLDPETVESVMRQLGEVMAINVPGAGAAKEPA